MTQQPDTALVTAALQDSEQFGALIDRYEQKLMRYIIRLTRVSVQCAEDILQNAFIKMYRNLNNFDAAFTFSSWAYRISHNEAISYVRKNKKVVSVDAADDDDLTLLEKLASDIDIASETASAETTAKVRKALDALPLQYREVLVLRYLEDKDYTEIGDILKKPIGTVGTLINRAKTHFKKIASAEKLDTLL